jgi:hypothetical protein
MKKILILLVITLITKTTIAQQSKHFEIILSDTIAKSFDTVYWQANTNVDYYFIELDSSILKQRNLSLENKIRKSIAEDSTTKLVKMLNLAVKNMKDVYIAPDFIIDNSNQYYRYSTSFTYVTTSDAGMKNFIEYCDSKKINATISSVKYKNNESSEMLLRKNLLEKSRKIALATLPSFNGKSIELVSITQTEPISNSSFSSSQNTQLIKQLLNDRISLKLASKLTLKFDYLIK